MSRKSMSIAVIVCALFAVSTRADTINWISFNDGY